MGTNDINGRRLIVTTVKEHKKSETMYDYLNRLRSGLSPLMYALNCGGEFNTNVYIELRSLGAIYTKALEDYANKCKKRVLLDEAESEYQREDADNDDMKPVA